MKKLVAISLGLFLGLNAFAQQIDLRRKISVSGNAEKEVTPDIIYLNITLKEYFENGKSGKKTEITTLEKQLFNAVQKAGIAKENLTISDLSSWNYKIEKRKNPEFLASKQYRLKVNDLHKFNAIVAELDPKGINSTYVESYDYSKMDALKKELKIKAILEAKTKATYMVEALGSKLGDVLEIQDGGDNTMRPMMYKNVRSMALSSEADEAPEIDFKTIKLNYTVNTIFEIK